MQLTIIRALRAVAAEEGTAPPAAATAAAARRAQVLLHCNTHALLLYHFRDNTRRRRPRRTPVTQRVSDVRLPGSVLFTFITIIIVSYFLLFYTAKIFVCQTVNQFFFVFRRDNYCHHIDVLTKRTPVTRILYIFLNFI